MTRLLTTLTHYTAALSAAAAQIADDAGSMIQVACVDRDFRARQPLQIARAVITAVAAGRIGRLLGHR